MTNNKVKSSTIEWTLAVIESSHLLTRPKENLWTSTTTVQRLKVSFYIQLYPIGFIISHAAIKCNTWWWKQKGMISAPLKVLKKKKTGLITVRWLTKSWVCVFMCVGCSLVYLNSLAYKAERMKYQVIVKNTATDSFCLSINLKLKI